MFRNIVRNRLEYIPVLMLSMILFLTISIKNHFLETDIRSYDKQENNKFSILSFGETKTKPTTIMTHKQST